MTEKRQTSQGYIIRILQHFATKLRNITNFVMLFQAVVKCLSTSKFCSLGNRSIGVQGKGVQGKGVQKIILLLNVQGIQSLLTLLVQNTNKSNINIIFSFMLWWNNANS